MSHRSAAESLLPSLPPGARILIIRLRSIGDIILLTPALRLLKEWRPDLHVTVMVETRFHELLDNNPDVNEILDLEKTTKGFAQLGARLGTIRQIRRGDYALCMNLHGGPTSATITSWSGAQWKAAFGHFRKKKIYDFLVPDPRTIFEKDDIHTAEHQASAFFHLGLPRKEIPAAQIHLTEADREWWSHKRGLLGITGKPYVVIHPTALFQTKQWAPEHFAALGARLKAGFAVIHSCGPGESHVLDEVEKAAGQKLCRLEGTGLRHFAAALAGARLFIGNDSGPAHMAAAVGIPGVVIFSSSSSIIWAPWRPRAPWRIVQNPFDCNPCPGDRCYKFDRPECILSVTLDQVLSAVEDVLAAPAAGKP